MSFLCGGRPLIECRLYLPQDGAFRARVEVDGTTEITGQVDLELPGVTFKCTVKRGGSTGSRVLAVLSPGMGTLAAPVGGQSFYEATPRAILQQTIGTGLAADGEVTDQSGTLESLAADLPQIVDEPIARWVRIAGPADTAVSRLASYLGMSWWFEPDGTIKLGELAYPPSSVSIDVLPNDNPEWARLMFASEEDTVMPRTTITTDYGSYAVTEVRYSLSDGIWRGVLHYA